MRVDILRATSLACAFSLLAVGPLTGQTTFHKFVGVGDSLIAGEEGGCLVQRYQNRSWVKLVADQLRIADFQQPLIQEKALSSPLTGQPCLGAVFAGGTITVGAVSQMGGNLNATLARPYDNLGMNGSPHVRDFVDLTTSVPGRSSQDNIAAVILRNFAGGPFEGKSAVDEANILNPDLVAFWAGNNDVLDAVFAGLALDGVTMTPVAAFEQKYTEVLTGLKASGRTIVTFNIPDVSAIAFSTTIPPVVVDPATRKPVLVNGHPVPLLGPGNSSFPCTPTPPDHGCSLPPGTLVTLPASTLLAKGVGIPTALGGTGLPLPDGSFTPPAGPLSAGVLLYPDEVASIQQRINDFNAKIASISAANGAILIDSHSLFNQTKAIGYQIGGITLTTDFLTGGLFSADGVHPSAIGYAIIADIFIKTLNAVKGTSIEEPDLSKAIFTPNVPTPSATATAEGGLYGFTSEMWKSILVGLEVEVVLPDVVTRAIVPIGRGRRGL